MQPGFIEPTLVTKKIMLDLDQSTCLFHFWQHSDCREFLCLGPSHMPKSWKRQIANPGLNAEKRKILYGRVWAFALKMRLCPYSSLDDEWENEVTTLALYLALGESEADLELLTSDLRLANQASACSHQVQMCTQETVQSQVQLYMHIADFLDSSQKYQL